MRPQTPAEWQAYVSTLTGDDLLSKAKAANSLSFVRSLESEGYQPASAIDIIRLFARRLVEDGQVLPTAYTGGLMDLSLLG